MENTYQDYINSCLVLYENKLNYFLVKGIVIDKQELYNVGVLIKSVPQMYENASFLYYLLDNYPNLILSFIFSINVHLGGNWDATWIFLEKWLSMSIVENIRQLFEHKVLLIETDKNESQKKNEKAVENGNLIGGFSGEKEETRKHSLREDILNLKEVVDSTFVKLDNINYKLGINLPEIKIKKINIFEEPKWVIVDYENSEILIKLYQAEGFYYSEGKFKPFESLPQGLKIYLRINGKDIEIKELNFQVKSSEKYFFEYDNGKYSEERHLSSKKLIFLVTNDEDKVNEFRMIEQNQLYNKGFEDFVVYLISSEKYTFQKPKLSGKTDAFVRNGKRLIYQDFPELILPHYREKKNLSDFHKLKIMRNKREIVVVNLKDPKIETLIRTEEDHLIMNLSALLKESKSGFYKIVLYSNSEKTKHSFYFHFIPGFLTTVPKIEDLNESAEVILSLPSRIKMNRINQPFRIEKNRLTNIYDYIIDVGCSSPEISFSITYPDKFTDERLCNFSMESPCIMWKTNLPNQETWQTKKIILSFLKFRQLKPIISYSVPTYYEAKIFKKSAILMNKKQVLQRAMIKKNKIQLNNFWDTINNINDREYTVILEIITKNNITHHYQCCEIHNFYDIYNLEINYENNLVNIMWDEDAGIANKCLRMWRIWKPWMPPIVFNLKDGEKRIEIELNRTLTPGEYRLEFSQNDPYIREENNQLQFPYQEDTNYSFYDIKLLENDWNTHFREIAKLKDTPSSIEYLIYCFRKDGELPLTFLRRLNKKYLASFHKEFFSFLLFVSKHNKSFKKGAKEKITRVLHRKDFLNVGFDMLPNGANVYPVFQYWGFNFLCDKLNVEINNDLQDRPDPFFMYLNRIGDISLKENLAQLLKQFISHLEDIYDDENKINYYNKLYENRFIIDDTIQHTEVNFFETILTVFERLASKDMFQRKAILKLLKRYKSICSYTNDKKSKYRIPFYSIDEKVLRRRIQKENITENSVFLSNLLFKSDKWELQYYSFKKYSIPKNIFSSKKELRPYKKTKSFNALKDIVDLINNFELTDRSKILQAEVAFSIGAISLYQRLIAHKLVDLGTCENVKLNFKWSSVLFQKFNKFYNIDLATSDYLIRVNYKGEN